MRLMTERVVLSAPKISTLSIQSRGEEPPENGTQFLSPTDSQGDGTILVTNELDSDALVILMHADGRQSRSICVRQHMGATMAAIPPGQYVIAYTVGSSWQKGK